MFRVKIASIVMITLVAATSATAGPFGLNQGMTLEQLSNKKLEKVAHGKYKLVKVPKSHSAFEAYIVQVSPKSGLCWIKAVGKDIPTSVYGLELKTSFETMQKKLEKSYAKHQTMDVLMPDSIWSDPKDFTMAMLKKERFLISIWDVEKGSILPDDIKQIALSAGVTRQDRGYISLEYAFKNYDDCQKELASAEDDAL